MGVVTPSKRATPTTNMAFKLVGDQFSQIRRLKKKRVNHLLAGQIPDNEALRMRDGRYACLICGHCPVFDTIATLTIHRNGRRHIQSAHRCLRKKELQRQEQITKSELSETENPLPPLLSQTAQAIDHALLSSTSQSKSTKTTSTEDEFFFSRKRKMKLSQLDRDIRIIKNNEEETTPVSKSELVFPRKSKVKNDALSSCHGNKKSSEQQKSDSKFVKLCSSGWIPNTDGTWSKDPNVEFDSEDDDEELS